ARAGDDPSPAPHTALGGAADRQPHDGAVGVRRIRGARHHQHAGAPFGLHRDLRRADPAAANAGRDAGLLGLWMLSSAGWQETGNTALATLVGLAIFAVMRAKVKS